MSCQCGCDHNRGAAAPWTGRRKYARPARGAVFIAIVSVGLAPDKRAEREAVK